MYPIAEIDGVTMAFPASVSHLMPAMKDIPREFHNGRGKWNQLVNDWFFVGVKNLKLAPKQGVDKDKALRHIKTVMGSFEPQHEHKEAACAYLLNEWFSDGTWERVK